jgi:hypothetical protein
LPVPSTAAVTHDAERLQSRRQRRRLHAEQCRGASPTEDTPATGRQSPTDVLALETLKFPAR